MGLDDGFDPFPDAGTFRLRNLAPDILPRPHRDPPGAEPAREAERASGRGRRRWSCPTTSPPSLAGALEHVPGADLPDRSTGRRRRPRLLARVRGLARLQGVVDAALAQARSWAADVRSGRPVRRPQVRMAHPWLAGHLNVSTGTADRGSGRAGRCAGGTASLGRGRSRPVESPPSRPTVVAKAASARPARPRGRGAGRRRARGRRHRRPPWLPARPARTPRHCLPWSKRPARLDRPGRPRARPHGKASASCTCRRPPRQDGGGSYPRPARRRRVREVRHRAHRLPAGRPGRRRRRPHPRPAARPTRWCSWPT